MATNTRNKAREVQAHFDTVSPDGGLSIDKAWNFICTQWPDLDILIREKILEDVGELCG